MSLYRTLLAAVAAIAIASPVFAEGPDAAAQNPAADATPAATQANDNNATQQVSANDQQSDMAKELKLNLNKASAKELMKVKGIDASRAKAIVAYRKKHGDFKSLDDLAKVKGFAKIKADNLHKIQDQLTIE